MTSVRSLEKQKNSLVRNINLRRRTGTARIKADSTIAEKSYAKMRRGWK